MYACWTAAALQICLFCTIWHQTQQTAECLLPARCPIKIKLIAALRAHRNNTYPLCSDSFTCTFHPHRWRIFLQPPPPPPPPPASPLLAAHSQMLHQKPLITGANGQAENATEPASPGQAYLACRRGKRP